MHLFILLLPIVLYPTTFQPIIMMISPLCRPNYFNPIYQPVDSTTNILFSSGTTGKKVILKHKLIAVLLISCQKLIVQLIFGPNQENQKPLYGHNFLPFGVLVMHGLISMFKLAMFTAGQLI